MSARYDNWERLVCATLRREQFHELARASSIETSSSSTISTDSSFNLKPPHHGDFGQRILVWYHLTDQVIKGADAATSFKLECLDLKSKTRQLKLLLRYAIPVSNTIGNNAHHRIMDDLKKVLHLAVNLVRRCSRMRCICTNICSASFEAMSTQTEHCIWNLSGIICDEHPTVRCYIRTLIKILIKGSPDDQVETAIALAMLSHDVLYSKSINKECGVQVLLRLLERVKLERQDYAKKVIRSPKIGNQLLSDETISHFVRVLKEGSTNLQAIVAWAASELIVSNPRFHNIFAEDDLVQLLVNLLSRDQLCRTSQKEDTFVYRNIMAARALWHLLKGNGTILRTILNSRALNHLSVLLKKGPSEAQYYSIMVLMEISSVVESALRSLITMDKVPAAYIQQIFLRNSSRVYRNIIKQLFILTYMPHSEMLVPCIKTVGNLHGVSSEADTWMTKSLWILLADIEQGAEIHKEACIALSKFALHENFPPSVCSNVINSLLRCRGDITCAGVFERLVQLLHDGSTNVQLQQKALFLLCYMIVHIPETANESPVETTSVLEWASKQTELMKCISVNEKLHSARIRMELYTRNQCSGCDVKSVHHLTTILS